MENKNKIMSALQVIKIALEATKEKVLITKGLLIELKEKYQCLDNLKDIRKDPDVIHLSNEVEQLAEEIGFIVEKLKNYGNTRTN